jgi:hypothetical protein
LVVGVVAALLQVVVGVPLVAGLHLQVLVQVHLVVVALEITEITALVGALVAVAVTQVALLLTAARVLVGKVIMVVVTLVEQVAHTLLAVAVVKALREILPFLLLVVLVVQVAHGLMV